MEKYTGNIPIPQDENNLNVVLAGLISYVANTQDASRGSGTPAEREDLAASINIALHRINVPQVHRRTINEFDLECLIGFGSFGHIWKAESDKFGQVALKQLKADLSSLTNLWNERDLMVLLKHKRICNLIAAFYDKDVYFVLELCHGSVAHLCNRISRENAVRFSVQLLQAVEWIHSQKTIHADIKPDNCLINMSNNLVLGDFGSAVYLGSARTSVQFSTIHGSPGYMDLRANKFLEFSPATDVFATACVIFELNTKSPLLFYQFQSAQSRQIYIDAFDKGRVMTAGSSGANANQGVEREQLTDRVMKCNFGPLLKKMIQDDNRVTAALALEDSLLRQVMQEAKVNLDTIDKSTKFVTREFTQDFSYSFDNLTSYSTPELELALLTFDYEEHETESSAKTLPSDESSSDNEPVPVKCLVKPQNKKRKIDKSAFKKKKSATTDDSDASSSI